MSRKVEFVQVEAGEDVISVKDRLSFIRGTSVLLIWPEEGTALTRKLDLVLIQREAMRRAIRLALVTHDAEVVRNATELNISTFETIGASERARWKRGRSRVFTTRFQRPKDAVEPEELMDVASRVRSDEEERSPLRRLAIRFSVLAVLIAVVGGVAYVVIPGATITLTPAALVVQAQVPIIADPTLSLSEVSPGQEGDAWIISTRTIRLEIEDTASIPTTGLQQLDSVLATGTVFFVNRTEQEIGIPQDTLVSTGTGTPVMFRTTLAVTLPAGAGQEVEVPIEAMPTSSGDVGNIGVNLINIVIGPLDSEVNVVNRAPTFGGENRTLNVVGEGDQDYLLGLLRQQLQSRAYVEMQPLLTATQSIVEETIHIAEERTDLTIFSAQTGDPATTLTLTMRVIVEAIAVDEQDARQIVFLQLANQIARGRFIREETLTYEHSPYTYDSATGRISFTMSGSGLVTGQVNTGQLQSRLAGRTPGDALDYLMREVDLAENTTPTITITPSWFGRMPIWSDRITIVVQDG